MVPRRPAFAPINLLAVKLLITGAAGMLGTDMRAAAAEAGHQVVACSRADLDITNREAVAAEVAAAQPDAIINCAAYTNVDGAESDPDGAGAVNASGPRHLAQAATACGAWLIHISTDYVFDGTKTLPYLESDATAPRSVYGATKLLGEQAVALAAPDNHTIVRTSWLFGAAGPCFPATMLRLAREGKALTVVDDQVGCPTFTGHLAGALVRLASVARIPGVLHVAASGECSWYQFAVEIMRETATPVQVTPCNTDQFPRPARRPAYSVLRSARPDAPVLPDWHDGLHQYLKVRELA